METELGPTAEVWAWLTLIYYTWSQAISAFNSMGGSDIYMWVTFITYINFSAWQTYISPYFTKVAASGLIWISV